MRSSRRAFLTSSSAAAAALLAPRWLDAAPRLRVTGVELLPVRATERTVWLFVRLRTDAGLTGLGEASDAFGFANTTKADAARMESELRGLFELVNGQSPLDIERYRQRGLALASKGLVQATAFSAIEQALWDLAGQALDLPVSSLFGGAVRDRLDVYANVNRATNPRTPDGFAASARAAVRDGFRSVKAAPWDGFPPAGSPAARIEAAVQAGIDATRAIREAVGPGVEIMVDCHSFGRSAERTDESALVWRLAARAAVDLAARVARELEPVKLAWYEEPVAPEKLEETIAIRRRISQPMAGGEVLFGMAGFAPLTRNKAVNVIMPDVKHCGGLLELTRIAAMADADGVAVAPHNPSGPVSTAASVQVCAVLRNFRLLELQWGEATWRSEVLDPPERFVNGSIAVPSRPGLGVKLNDRVVRAHPL